MIDRETADEIYFHMIENLAGAMRSHIVKGRMKADGTPYTEGSILGFCETYGIDRPNFMRCLARKKDISVGLFQRICLALGVMKSAEVYDEEAILNLSLRHFLRIDGFAVRDAIMKLEYRK